MTLGSKVNVKILVVLLVKQISHGLHTDFLGL